MSIDNSRSFNLLFVFNLCFTTCHFLRVKAMKWNCSVSVRWPSRLFVCSSKLCSDMTCSQRNLRYHIKCRNIDKSNILFIFESYSVIVNYPSLHPVLYSRKPVFHIFALICIVHRLLCNRCCLFIFVLLAFACPSLSFQICLLHVHLLSSTCSAIIFFSFLDFILCCLLFAWQC